MKRNKKTSQLANYVEWLNIKSYFEEKMKGKLHRQPRAFVQEVFKRMVIKHKIKQKMLLFLFFSFLFFSCEKEPLYRKVFFTFEVIEAPVTIEYLSNDGYNVVYKINHPGKPIFGPSGFPSQIKVSCDSNCVYKVNGKEFTQGKTFNF